MKGRRTAALEGAACLAAAVLAAACAPPRERQPRPGRGAIVLQREHGAAEHFGAQAAFVTSAGVLYEPFTAGAQSVDPLVLADGQCADASTSAAPTQLALDAGPALTVGGATSSFDLPREPGGLYSATTSPSSFVPGGSWTVSGPGGADVPSFTSTLTMPADLQVSAPDFSHVVTARQSSSLRLTWAPAAPAQSVFVAVEQGDGVSAAATICRLPDTGAAALGSSLLGRFQPSASVPDLATSIVVFRLARTAVSAGTDPTDVIGVVDAQSALDLQP